MYTDRREGGVILTLLGLLSENQSSIKQILFQLGVPGLTCHFQRRGLASQQLPERGVCVSLEATVHHKEAANTHGHLIKQKL